ncbi:hypothetical protein BvRS1_37150 [Burkholderia vietnamiensis]|nr:hypothetical protein BvRS1_37150 [Burkholderia vietnamiensis]
MLAPPRGDPHMLAGFDQRIDEPAADEAGAAQQRDGLAFHVRSSDGRFTPMTACVARGTRAHETACTGRSRAGHSRERPLHAAARRAGSTKVADQGEIVPRRFFNDCGLPSKSAA